MVAAGAEVHAAFGEAFVEESRFALVGPHAEVALVPDSAALPEYRTYALDVPPAVRVSLRRAPREDDVLRRALRAEAVRVPVRLVRTRLVPVVVCLAPDEFDVVVGAPHPVLRAVAPEEVEAARTASGAPRSSCGRPSSCGAPRSSPP